MTHLLARLEDPGSPRHLALVRIVLGLHVMTLFTSPAIPILRELGAQPNRLTNTLVPPLVEEWLEAHLVMPMMGVGLVATALVVIGLHTRLATAALWVAFVVTHHFYYRHTHYHDDWPYLWFLLLVLAMAPCADAWSVDAWLARRRGAIPVEPSTRHRWPIELMIAWFALIYVAAGLSKLLPLRKGVEWLDGPTVHRLVALRYFDSPLQWVLGRPLFDYSLSWPFELMAKTTVLVEVGAVALVLSRRSYPWVFASIIGMHVAIYLFGVPGFLQTALLCGVLLLPARWFERSLSTPAEAPSAA